MSHYLRGSTLVGKKVLVLGLGDTGYSMARWLDRQGAQLCVADTRASPPHALKLKHDLPNALLYAGPLRAESFADIDLIALSPGIALSEPLVQEASKKGVEIVGDIELFARALSEARARNAAPAQARVIGITGSNGKSTVTTMVADMCKAAGLRTIVAGNIGLPALDALAGEQENNRPDAYVLELSSFQLETTSSLQLDAATVLNVTQDHMDRYPSMAQYAAAKARIFAHCAAQVLNRDDPLSLEMILPATSVCSFGLDAPNRTAEWGVVSHQGSRWLAEANQRLMAVDELPIAGLHNAANALAALALTRSLRLPYEPLLHALRRFRGLPHRLEKVMEIDGVLFYDDSKGTNVGATVAALNGMTEPVVLIAGGDGKGQDFSPLNRAVRAKARAVILIGRDAQLIANAIEPSGVHQLRAADMPEAVRLALSVGKRGDAVLLSPACASFDMFNSYVHRAQVFVDAVRALAAEQHAGLKQSG